MEQTQTGKGHIEASLDCQRCGGAMRLIGSEPHPIHSRIDLLRFGCSVCDALVVLPIEFPLNDPAGGAPSAQGVGA